MSAPDAAGYEHFEHTADLGIRAWGPSLERAFAEAARGMIAYMVEVPDRAAGARTTEVRVEADTPDRRLFEFLDELLFLLQTELLVPVEYDVEFDGDAVIARVAVEAYDPERHGHIHEIKAMTYHGMRVEHAPPRVEVIVDI